MVGHVLQMERPRADYSGAMPERPGQERRGSYDRRALPRVTRCGQCHAHLIVDRRGPTVALYSAATYIPLAARSLEPPTEAPPRCPACGAMLTAS